MLNLDLAINCDEMLYCIYKYVDLFRCIVVAKSNAKQCLNRLNVSSKVGPVKSPAFTAMLYHDAKKAPVP
jgi:hypothetical protein